MTKLRYKVQKSVFRFIGDMKWHGILHPFWITINAKTFQLKGTHYRELEKLIHPGDIIIRRFDGYVDAFLLPGFWNHAGIYVGQNGNTSHQVIHAISDGVVACDLIDFMRTDHMIVLRPPSDMVEEAISRAMGIVGEEYDFEFDFKGHSKFSCTEVIDFCYPHLIQLRKRFGKMTIVADDIVACDKFTKVWKSGEQARRRNEVEDI